MYVHICLNVAKLHIKFSHTINNMFLLRNFSGFRAYTSPDVVKQSTNFFILSM